MTISRILLIAFLIMSLPAMGQSRKELKRMCKDEFKVCKKSHKARYCRKERKKCRQENNVSFKDDLKLFKAKVKKVVAKTVGQVVVHFGEDEELGEFLRVSVESKAFKNVQDFTYSPEEVNSFIEIVQGADGEKKEFAIVVYSQDLEDQEVGTYLQTTEGRLYPKFINGVRFESMFGIPFAVGGVENFHLYLDPGKRVVGAFIPTGVSGTLIQKLNDFKNDDLGKVGKIFPDINSLPINVKVDKIKIGRFSILSNDENGENAGVVILFDIEKLKLVAK